MQENSIWIGEIHWHTVAQAKHHEPSKEKQVAEYRVAEKSYNLPEKWLQIHKYTVKVVSHYTGSLDHLTYNNGRFTDCLAWWQRLCQLSVFQFGKR